MDSFWNEYQINSDTFKCCDCGKEMKSRMSRSEKNPNRVFVSCSKDNEGCGLFCFLDTKPLAKFRKQAKRERKDDDAPFATVATGPLPDAQLMKILEKLDALERKVDLLIEGDK